MFVVIWRFTTATPAEFEREYGPNGSWATLFGRSEDYGGTDLLKDGDTYLTMDWWLTRAAYEQFRIDHAADYAALDARCEALTASEESWGSSWRRWRERSRRRRSGDEAGGAD
ncbi:MAG TPA: hypothetical protein VEK57_22820 [Thermoanaerobaculia bacterium]|nr:hypothetical protein [Thermoanaerobaculia bacterium]